MVASLEEAQALKSAGIGLFRNGDYQQALELFSKALDRLPSDANVHAQRSNLLCNRAIAYNRLQQFAEAEREASAAIVANPANAKAYYHRMISRRQLQDQHGFRNDFDKFSQLKDQGDERPDPGFLSCIDAAISQAFASPTENDRVFLLESSWWNRLRAFYSGADSHPGPIDNQALIERPESDDRRSTCAIDDTSAGSKQEASLGDRASGQGSISRITLPPFDDGLTLRAGLRRDTDFVAVPESVWKMLREQFNGGPEIRRPIRGGAVDHRGLHVVVQRLDAISGPSINVEVACSHLHMISEVIRALCSLWTTTASEIRAVRPRDGCFEPVSSKLRLCDLGLADHSTLFIEKRSATGVWPQAKQLAAVPAPGEYDTCRACFDRISPEAAGITCDLCQQAKYCSWRCRQSHSRWHEKVDHHRAVDNSARPARSPPGTAGLMNIGNSCYINAVLQCLSSTHELTRVFLSNDFIHDLNRDNPLGCKGRLAEAYADLLKEMWFNDAPYSDPREFKRAVSCFATQFAGCQQQDAQEFLAFLLDGIHEDLNRIRSKPYIPTTESDGRPDEVVAQEQWTNYLARDQSVVVDCLLGQLKSEVICAASPTCPPSVTFDPFMYVLLPLPEPIRIIAVMYFPVSGQVPTQFHVKVERMTAEVLEAAVRPILLERADFSPDNQLVCTAITNSRPLLFLPKTTQPIEIAPSQELAIFECRPRHIPISCIIRQIPKAARDPGVFFRGRPFVVDFCLDSSPRLTGLQVYQRVYAYLRRSLYRPDAEPSFWIEMFYNSERAVINKTDEPVDLHYYMRPVLVITWNTEDVLNEVDMNELLRVERDAEGFAAPLADRTTTLYDCFKAFTKTESLGVDDWECSSCHKKGDASKRMSFWRLPDVLILHLKRFDSVRRHALFGEAANKISKEVQFPLKDLDLTPFVSTKDADQPVPLYELFGVINHYGASFFGHYTAFTKGLDGVWRHFDDDTVKVVPPEEICQSNAYLLFYRRQQG